MLWRRSIKMLLTIRTNNWNSSKFKETVCLLKFKRSKIVKTKMLLISRQKKMMWEAYLISRTIKIICLIILYKLCNKTLIKRILPRRSWCTQETKIKILKRSTTWQSRTPLPWASKSLFQWVDPIEASLLPKLQEDQ